MPFPIAEDLIAAAEHALGAALPLAYRTAMAQSNGGEVEVADDGWQLHPIEDRSDRKRAGRTANHILRETNQAKTWPHFPPNALCIASNGTGDLLVFLRNGTEFAQEVYLWSHEDGSVQRIAASFHELAAGQ